MTIIAPVVTIDGPSSAGKGTLCAAMAKILHWHLLDSGAIYRVLALTAIHHQVALDSEDALMPLADHLDVCFMMKQGKLNIMLEGKDVSQVIRNDNIGNTASKIATFPLIRKVLLHRQRTFRIAPGLVADGRDMGTVVFPDAPVKFFLNASSEIRVQRRILQLQKKKLSVNIRGLLSEINERDNRDYDREIAPLIPATDALVLDSTCLSIDEMIAKAMAHVKHILTLP